MYTCLGQLESLPEIHEKRFRSSGMLYTDCFRFCFRGKKEKVTHQLFVVALDRRERYGVGLEYAIYQADFVPYKMQSIFVGVCLK